MAVSKDGRWLAIGGFNIEGIRIWDLPGRRQIQALKRKEAVGLDSLEVVFSPDGDYLISSHIVDGFQSWQVGTWEPAPARRIIAERSASITRPPVFTSDGRLMALTIAPDQVRLAETSTGRELTRLTTLQPIIPTPVAFTDDGTKLVLTTAQSTVLIWDLQRIRDQLAPLGLDWDAPVYHTSTASTAGTAVRPTPPPYLVRAVGKVPEPQARRDAERAEMDRRLEANPDDAAARMYRGWLSHTEWKLPAAIADMDRLHRQQPDYPDVERKLLEAYDQAGNDPAGNLKFWLRVLERAPKDLNTRFRRALIAAALGRTQQAADDFEQVLAAEPTNDTVRYQRARALNRLGRYRDALADVDLLSTRYPDKFALFHLSGTAYDALGEREPARLAWEKALALLSKDPDILNKTSWAMAAGPLTQRDPERALVMVHQAIALAPDKSLYLNTLGAALYGAGRYSEAIDVLERSLAVGRGETDAFELLFLAMAHRSLEHRAQARHHFNQAMRWLDGRRNLLPQHAQELAAIRAEANAVLAGPGAELPFDVFIPP